MPLSKTNARSFHSRPTQSQPDTPTRDKHRSTNGNCCVERNANAHKRNILAIHLTYQDKSCLGVALLYILLLFSISSFVYFIYQLLYLAIHLIPLFFYTDYIFV